MAGLIICGMGVGIFLYSGLGVDPASVFELGIGNVFHISYGTSSAAINVVILAIVFFLDKSYINIASILAIFGIGYTADFVNFVLGIFLKGEQHIIVRLILIIIGLLIMSTGIATYIRADLGVGAIDLVSEIISNKLKISYRGVRVSADVAFVVIGFLLGGSVGIGTVLAAFMTGPSIQFLRPHIYKVTDRILKKE
ncbi:MAG: membrane protein [Lachnospiraceae bacterium]|nr:membrane protein [Lachnospiraceae bacterium]MDE6185043.1 membrane protein [Lachnospiraceae bacterium]